MPRTALLALLIGVAAALPAHAQSLRAMSCYDLWYERNRIYAENGYCFSTPLARDTFAGYECWTRDPDLTPNERNYVAAIQREERRRGCKVN